MALPVDVDIRKGYVRPRLYLWPWLWTLTHARGTLGLGCIYGPGCRR